MSSTTRFEDIEEEWWRAGRGFNSVGIPDRFQHCMLAAFGSVRIRAYQSLNKTTWRAYGTGSGKLTNKTHPSPRRQQKQLLGYSFSYEGARSSTRLFLAWASVKAGSIERERVARSLLFFFSFSFRMGFVLYIMIHKRTAAFICPKSHPYLEEYLD